MPGTTCRIFIIGREGAGFSVSRFRLAKELFNAFREIPTREVPVWLLDESSEPLDEGICIRATRDNGFFGDGK